MRRCCARCARRWRRPWRTDGRAPTERARSRKQRAEEPTELPYPKLAALDAEQVPDFFSGCFGLGSRDLQPGDIVAAVENMLPSSKRLRQFYLGIDFIRPDTRLPKLQIWQEQLLESYPHLAELALHVGGRPRTSRRRARSPCASTSVGGWGAITMGKNLSMTVFELLGMHMKANPKYGSEKKGQPTTFYAVVRARAACGSTAS